MKLVLQEATIIFDRVLTGQRKISRANVVFFKAFPNRKLRVSHERKTFLHSQATEDHINIFASASKG